MAKGKMKIIEVFIRFVFINLFLVSFGSVGMGGVGDVYFCEEIENIVIGRQDGGKLSPMPGEIIHIKSGNFKFKMDSNEIIFSKDKSEDYPSKLQSGETFKILNLNPPETDFIAVEETPYGFHPKSYIMFNNNRNFSFTGQYWHSIKIIIAECETF